MARTIFYTCSKCHRHKHLCKCYDQEKNIIKEIITAENSFLEELDKARNNPNLIIKREKPVIDRAEYMKRYMARRRAEGK